MQPQDNWSTRWSATSQEGRSSGSERGGGEGKSGSREPCHYTVHAASSALCSLCAQIDKWTARSEGQERPRETETDGRTQRNQQQALTHALRTPHITIKPWPGGERARRARTASGVVVASSNDPFSATAAETASLHVKDMFQSRRQRVPRLSAFFRCKGLSLSTCWAEGSVSKSGTGRGRKPALKIF